MLPCWGLCEAHRAEHRPQHCPARRRMTAPLRGPEYRLTLLGARCCPPAGGLLSGPHFKRGLATGGSVGPQRTRGVEGGTGWDAGLSGRQRSAQMLAARWAGYADKVRPGSVGWVWCWPPPPLVSSTIYRTLSVPWGDNKGAAPLYPGVAPMLWF